MADDLKLKIQVEVDDKIDSSKIEKQAEKAGQEIGDNMNKWISGSIAKWMAIWDTIKWAIQKIWNLTKEFLQDSIKLANEYESAFAWVRKTVDGTEKEFSKLDNSLKKMAKEIPLTYKELAGIMELWWQLGVQTKDLDKFTRSVAQLWTATNLTSENAAQMLAQFANITKMDLNDIDRLWSVIVDLWNNFATTESDIVNFAQRIAGAWEIAGISQPNIMAIATAFSSVGIEAEAWGTAVQKVLLDMNSAVNTWGDQLEKYAKIIWKTTDEFKKLYQEHPEQVFIEFVKALQDSGQEAQNLLDALWLSDQRLVRGFLSLSQNADILTDAINRSNDAWEQNIALSNEAQQRYSTTESQIVMQQNERANMMAWIGEKLQWVVLIWEEVKTKFVDAIGSFLWVTTEASEATDVLKWKIEEVTGQMDELQKKYKEWGMSLDDYVREMIKLEEEQKRIQKAYDEEIKRREDLKDSIEKLKDIQEYYLKSYQEWVKKYGEWAKWLDELKEKYENVTQKITELEWELEKWISTATRDIVAKEKQEQAVKNLDEAYQAVADSERAFNDIKIDWSQTRAEFDKNKAKAIELWNVLLEDLRLQQLLLQQKISDSWRYEWRPKVWDILSLWDVTNKLNTYEKKFKEVSNATYQGKDWWVLGGELLWWWWGGGWWGSKSKAEDMLKSFKDEMNDLYKDMDSSVNEHQKNYDKLVDNIEKTEKEYDKLREKATETWKDAEKAIKDYNRQLEESQTDWLKSLGQRYVDLQEQWREIDNDYLKKRIGDISDGDWARIRDEWYSFLWYDYNELKKIKEIYDELKLIEENTTEEQRKSAEFTEKTSKAQEILNQMKEKEAELEEKKAIALEKQAIAQAMMSQENGKQYIKTLEDKGTFYYDTVKKQREQVLNEDNIEYAKQLENQSVNLNDQLQQFKEEKDNEVEILTTITARKIQLEKEYDKTFQEAIAKQKQSVNELIARWETLIAKKNEYYSSSSTSARAYGWDISNAKVALVWENWPEQIIARTASYIQPRNASNSYSTVNNNNSSNLTINWMSNSYGSIDEMLEDLKWRLTYRD